MSSAKLPPEPPADSKDMRPEDWALIRRALARTSIIAYIRMIAPWFTIEEIHCVIAAFLENMESGAIDRGMIFLPPRTGKSMMGSVFFPSHWAGLYPSDKILQVGHSVELSRGFSLDVRQIMKDPEYSFIFPGVRLAKDSQAAGKWRVEDTYGSMEALERAQARAAARAQQGQYNAAGVTSNLAGKGFNLGIGDDLMSEQDKDSKIVKQRIWDWWGPGFYTRRQPDRNAILLMMTRWANDDIAGRILDMVESTKHRGADYWEVLNVPAILDRDSAKKIVAVAKEYGQMSDVKQLREGDSFAPRRWTLKELGRSRASMTERDWNALYLGKPDADEGHILKEKNFRIWPEKEMPECFEIFDMYDTAFGDGEQNDYSARSRWGLFRYRETEGERALVNMILLGRWKQRIDAPDLVVRAMVDAWGSKETRRALKTLHRDPDYTFLDSLVIENGGNEIPAGNPNRMMFEMKASAQWLVRELRRINKPRRLPVFPWLIPRFTAGGNKGKEMDKVSRAHYGNLVAEQGAVWIPDRVWARGVAKAASQCKFDGSDESDDLEDTLVASMIYVRQSYRVELPTDIDEEAEKKPRYREKRQFYGARTG